MRSFLGAENVGPFHVLPSKYEGSHHEEIPIHAHAHDHLAILSPGDWDIWIERAGSERLTVPPDQFAWRNVPAGRRHWIKRLSPGGMSACVFARYDEHGSFLPEPKVAARPLGDDRP